MSAKGVLLNESREVFCADQIAEELSERSLGTFSIYLASNSNDFDHVENLWQSVYVDELSWLTSHSNRKNGNRLHEDAYHSQSAYLLAKSGDSVIGTLRLVFDSDSVGLPVEQFFPLGVLKNSSEKTVEAHRLMVCSKFRNVRLAQAPFGVSASLLKAGFQYCFRKQVSRIFLDAFLDTPTTPIKTFKSIGFREVGQPFIDSELSDTSPSVAMVIDVLQLLSSAYTKKSRFFKYLFTFDPAIDFSM
jgi:Acetyltransferase (GNAT) domain